MHPVSASPTRTREFVFYLALVLVLLTAIIWIRVKTIKRTYYFFQREKEHRLLQQDIQNLKVQWLTLTSPKRLEQLAPRFELGPPQTQQVVRFKAPLEDE